MGLQQDIVVLRAYWKDTFINGEAPFIACSLNATEQKVLRKFRVIMSTDIKSYSIVNIFTCGSESVLDLNSSNTFIDLMNI